MPKRQRSTRRAYLTTLLTTGQAARQCEVSVPTLRNWIQDGKLAAFRTPGGHYRIERRAFRQFLQVHGMPPYPVSSPEIRILVVDDEPDIVDLLVGFLAQDPRGFKLETATDGYEGLIKVGTFRPSLLILDVLMPRLDGIRVCRHLKANSETRGIKILGITGFPDNIPPLMEAGADACVTKPLDFALVRQELERLLPSIEA